jgi:hypothetical protein
VKKNNKIIISIKFNIFNFCSVNINEKTKTD